MRHLNPTTPCLALCLALLPLAACKPATAASAPPLWLYAVVFHLNGGVANYAGVADVSSASGRLQQLLRDAPAPTEASKSTLADPSGADDIWLEGNGCSAEVLWRPATSKYSVAENGRMTRPLADGGVVGPLVAAVRPYLAPPGFAPNPASPSAAIGTADYPAPPRDLAGMVRESPVIVRGRVVAVLREQHTPQNYDGPDEDTVFLVAVERYLRGANSGSSRVLKVMNEGGDLPWVVTALGARGVAARTAEDPMPAPGSRYIMFLQLMATRGVPGQAAGPLMAEMSGIRGKVGEMDEYMFPEPSRGKILLDGDVATALPMHGKTTEWKFADGEQIVGVPASQTEAAILHAATLPPAPPSTYVPFGGP